MVDLNSLGLRLDTITTSTAYLIKKVPVLTAKTVSITWNQKAEPFFGSSRKVTFFMFVIFLSLAPSKCQSRSRYDIRSFQKEFLQFQSQVLLFVSFTVLENHRKKSHSTLRAKRATFTFTLFIWLKMPKWYILASF